ncbi:hypothetical protein [Paraburkholderia sp.]|uniref:hypothetical protein n=1 Tax=Paraburkholderia sp. TaxID=1926495 RepID=UPI0039E3497E
MNANEHHALLARTLAEKLDAIESARAAIDAAADPVAALVAIKAMREDVERLAIRVFSHAAILRARSPDATIEEKAAGIVASRLHTFPGQNGDRDDARRWRVSFPYVFVPKNQALTPAQLRERQCYLFVSRLIASGKKWDEAARLAETEFRRSRSWVSGAYYNDTHRAELEPLLKIERGDAF